MSYTIPQPTGQTATSAPHELQHQDQYVAVAPPQYGAPPGDQIQYGAPAAGEYHNDKAQYPPAQSAQYPPVQSPGMSPDPNGPNGAPVPQQQYQQQQGATQNHFQNAIPLASLQQGAAPVDCPMCGARELTKTEYVSGGTTHGVAALLCVCLCLGCIPYLASWFKDVEHKCGRCGALLAVWHRSGRTEVLAHGRK